MGLKKWMIENNLYNYHCKYCKYWHIVFYWKFYVILENSPKISNSLIIFFILFSYFDSSEFAVVLQYEIHILEIANKID